MTADDIWDQGSATLRDQLAPATWATWFHGVRPLGYDGDALLLSVPSSLAAERIRSSYSGMLTDAIRDSTGVTVRVELLVETAPKVRESLALAPPPVTVVVEEHELDPLGGMPLDDTDDKGAATWASGTLNSRYTFDHFVIGASNRFAHAAALSVAETPARSYNPLFIYGPAGLGKTHLLHAIGNYVRTVFRNKRVRYVSTETFMNEFVDAIRTKEMPSFRRRYREVDVLLVDDIQFLERTPAAPGGVLPHVQLAARRRRPDRAVVGPAAEADPPARGPPPHPPRVGAHHRRPAARVRDPPRHPPDEGRVRAPRGHPGRGPGLHRQQHQRQRPRARGRAHPGRRLLEPQPGRALEEIARQVLADLLPPTTPRVITPELILDETAKMFGFTVEDLCGKSRRRPLVIARQIGMYVFRELTDFSYPRIAEEFGGRDHTTVMHAVEKIKGLMTERHNMFDQVNELMSRIRLGTGG